MVGRPARVDEVVRVAAQSEVEHRSDADRLGVLRQYQLPRLVEGRMVERSLARHQFTRGIDPFPVYDFQKKIIVVYIHVPYLTDTDIY